MCKQTGNPLCYFALRLKIFWYDQKTAVDQTSVIAGEKAVQLTVALCQVPDLIRIPDSYSPRCKNLSGSVLAAVEEAGYRFLT